MPYTALINFEFAEYDRPRFQRLGQALIYAGWKYGARSAYVYDQPDNQPDDEALKAIWEGIELISRGAAHTKGKLSSLTFAIQATGSVPAKVSTTPANAYKRLKGLPLASEPSRDDGGDEHEDDEGGDEHDGGDKVGDD